jgi:SAM-dependent methyltransferase
VGAGADWDAVADLRFEQIESGADVSYRKILIPAMRQLLAEVSGDSILDVGCGTGHLTSLLADSVRHIDAVDPSAKSIAIARARHPAPNITYHHADIESFATGSPDGVYDIAVASMTLMCLPDLRAALAGIARLLSPGGCLVATIPHPSHWADYAGYSRKPSYDPRKALEPGIRVTWPYRISTDRREGPHVVHYLHSLESYSSALEAGGMHFEKIREPFPSPEIEKLYPAPWDFPRYLAFQARKVR